MVGISTLEGVLPQSPVTDRSYPQPAKQLAREVDSAGHERGQIDKECTESDGVPKPARLLFVPAFL